MNNFKIPQKEIESFCQKYNIKELAVFGSFLRDDFNDNSDIDLLYTFKENSGYSLFDIVRIKEEIEIVFNRPVDFVSRKAIEKSKNIYRKRAILENSKVIYAS